MPQHSVRAKLLDAAMRRFHERGFKACTIEDIADEAGAVKGSLYNYFRNKEALGVAAVVIYREQSLAKIILEGPLPANERLRKHFEAIVEYQRARFDLQGCLLATFNAEVSPENAELKKALNDTMEMWYAAVAKLIRQAQAAGEIRKRTNPDRLARYLVNAWEGAHIRAKASRSQTPLDDFFKVTFDEILK
jgi:TetR/AcrR family transcriptional repressor of nem operon